MSDVVPNRLNPGVNGGHEHVWRCLEDGDSSGAWAFECTICHRTRAGLRVGRDGKVESASDIASQGQHASVDERERALDVRESTLQEQELRQMERRDEVENLLVKAAQRDEVTAARDAAATERDREADLHARLHNIEDRPSADARREALDDRMHSHGDRTASAVDRAMLADEELGAHKGAGHTALRSAGTALTSRPSSRKAWTSLTIVVLLCSTAPCARLR